MDFKILEAHVLFEAPASSIEALLRCIGALGHAKDLPQPLDKMNALTAWTDYFNPVTLEAHYVDKRSLDKRYPRLDSLRTLLQAIVDRIPDVECWGTFSYSNDKNNPTEIDYFIVKDGTIIIEPINIAALRRLSNGAHCLLHLNDGRTLQYVLTHDCKCAFNYKTLKLNNLHSTDEVFQELDSLFSPHYSQFDHKAVDVETGERANIRFSNPQDAIHSISVSDPVIFNPRATLYGRNYADSRSRIISCRYNDNALEMLIGSLQIEYIIAKRRKRKTTWEYPVSEDIINLFTRSTKRNTVNSCCINMEQSLEMIRVVYPTHIHKMCIDGGDAITAEWISMLLEDARGTLGKKKLAKRFNLVLDNGIKL